MGEDADGWLSLLDGHPNLQSLDIAAFRVTDAGIAEIARCLALRHLGLSFGERITSTGFAELRRLAKLQAVNLTRLGIDDAALLTLAQQSLEALHLDRCDHVTDEGLARLIEQTSLRSLELWNMDSVTGAFLAAVPNSGSLSYVEFVWCEALDGAHFEPLAEVERDFTIGLGRVSMKNRQVVRDVQERDPKVKFVLR